MNEPLLKPFGNEKTVDELENRPPADRLEFRLVLGGPQLLQRAVAEATQVFAQHLLLVEDSDDDAELFARAVFEAGRDNEIHRVWNGGQAYALLNEFTPALIVLDCYLCEESGLEILRQMRSRDALQRVPIVMLSGTECDSDVQSAYANGANSFLRKPATYGDYVEGIRHMLEYWLDRNCTSLSAWTPASCRDRTHVVQDSSGMLL
jgi:CheY-like chemotaxis protein